MLNKSLVLFILLNVLRCFNCGGELREYRRFKRADIDLQTCIDNFDVHHDKIIRTQDSQKMGAKYLNEIDLGSKEECLRLCCETENCDVFVFEEKNSGSCYLFQCGPPEDFKCKFTHHVNYSSAVLAINRHLPDLDRQMKLTKHEQDLSKLRRSESEPEVIPPVIPQISESNTAQLPVMVPGIPKLKEIVPLLSTKPLTEDKSKCSRFQFECRSNQECIAIYNVCNGIPQCTDGSDEAPELGCPETSTPPQQVPGLQNYPPPKYDNPVVQKIHLDPISAISSHQNSAYQIQVRPDTGSQYQSIGNINYAPVGVPNLQVPLNTPQLPQYSSILPIQPQMTWVPHQPIPNQVPIQQSEPYADKSSNIFTHKENGLQVSDSEISPILYVENPNNPLIKPQNYYNENYRQNVGQQPPNNWLPNIQNVSPYGTEYGPNSQSKNVNWQEDKSSLTGPAQSKVLPPNWTTLKVNPDHVQKQMAHELKHSKDTTIAEEKSEKTVETPKVKIEKHLSHTTDEKVPYSEVSAYRLPGTEDFKDGISETPSGAVLSLTLGLIITAVMALLIGCRLRVVRRRMRKGGKQYAHDADYLVNGMYL